MKKKIIVSALMLITIAIVAQADDKKENEDKDEKKRTRVYNGALDVVWKAAIRAASENFSVAHSDKESGTFEFHTGISMTSNGFRCSVTVTEMEDKRVRVRVNPQKKAQLFAWGAGGRIIDKFFKALDRNMKEVEGK
jgi:hypothetical protein